MTVIEIEPDVEELDDEDDYEFPDLQPQTEPEWGI